MKAWLTSALLLSLGLVLAACSPNAETGGAAALQGESAKPGRLLAYEHRVAIRLTTERLDPRLVALRDACRDERFGQCDLLTIERNESGYRTASLTVRIVPEGVEKLVDLASEGGALEERQTRAQDLAQAVNDNRQAQEALQRQQQILTQYQARPDLTVGDLLALTKQLAEIGVQLDALGREAAQQQKRIDTNLLTLDFSSEHTPGSRLARIGEAGSELLDNAAEGTAEALKMLGYGIPFLILLFPLALLVRGLWRKATHRPRRP